MVFMRMNCSIVNTAVETVGDNRLASPFGLPTAFEAMVSPNASTEQRYSSGPVQVFRQYSNHFIKVLHRKEQSIHARPRAMAASNPTGRRARLMGKARHSLPPAERKALRVAVEKRVSTQINSRRLFDVHV